MVEHSVSLRSEFKSLFHLKAPISFKVLVFSPLALKVTLPLNIFFLIQEAINNF